ncbi:MAG: Ppx/GppA phosphatase family protein [Proteobacteria bacterium]|nr:Ppx/GppA phosphatase family protein [Pseudomonadota bacterium]
MAIYVNSRRHGKGRQNTGRLDCAGRSTHVYAAIDLGTNNCRLLVARPTEDSFRVIDAFSRIVRLGEGVSDSGVLSEDAMERTIGALRICAAKMRRRHVDRARLIATDACRRAANCPEFLDRVEAETGLRIETISCQEEARLAMLGCAPLFDDEKRRALVFDIGGGSTEVTVANTKDCKNSDCRNESGATNWISLPFGVVGLSERYGDAAMTRERYGAMIDDVDQELAPFCARNDISGSVRRGELQMLGASGTVTTLTGVSMKLSRYDRGLVDGAFLEFDEIFKISDELRSMNCAERAAHPCIGSDRADLVVAGCAILEAMCRRWPVGRLRVADRGLREGILIDLMEAADREGQPIGRS